MHSNFLLVNLTAGRNMAQVETLIWKGIYQTVVQIDVLVRYHDLFVKTRIFSINVAGNVVYLSDKIAFEMMI